MSLFACVKCDTIENTALCNYWMWLMEKFEHPETEGPFCTQCDPEIQKWHGEFPRRNYIAENYQLCPEGKSRILCPKPDGWDYCKHGKIER